MDGTTDQTENHRHRSARRSRRNRSIRSAVSTSLASKASTAVLQFVSLPIAARLLGREEFGIYATVSTAILAVAMLQLGVGPALAKGISQASSKHDRRREASYYRNGALLLFLLVLSGLGISALVLSSASITFLFGDTYSSWETEMRSALWCGILLMAGQLIVAHTDRVREGYMEAASVNAASAFGNLAGACFLAVGISHFPTVEFILIAVFLPNILARIINTILLLRKRPYLLTLPGRLDRGIVRSLVHDGLSFTATSFVVFAVEFGLCALLVGRWLGPSEVAVFHILMALTTAFAGLLKMVGTPLWAAIIDAKGSSDIDWTRKTVRRYRLYMLALSGTAAVGLIGLGPLLFPVWYGEEFSANRFVFAAHAAFLFATGWRFIHRTLAIGFGKISATVAPITFGLVLEICCAVAGLHWLGLPGLFLGLATGALLVPGWILPRLIQREMNSLTSSQNHNPSKSRNVEGKSGQFASA